MTTPDSRLDPAPLAPLASLHAGLRSLPWPRLLPLLAVLAACRSAPPREDLPREHPAHPLAATPEYRPEPGPFALSTTFAVPGISPGATQDHGAGPRGDAPATYACPMHPEVEQAEPGTCPECGMALRPAPAHAHGEPDAEESEP